MSAAFQGGLHPHGFAAAANEDSLHIAYDRSLQVPTSGATILTCSIRSSMMIFNGVPPAHRKPLCSRMGTASQCEIPSLSVSQVNGSGPWGLPTPQDVGEMVNRIQAAAAPIMPRLQALMARPGAALARDEIIAGLQVTSSTCCPAYRAYCEHIELEAQL